MEQRNCGSFVSFFQPLRMFLSTLENAVHEHATLNWLCEVVKRLRIVMLQASRGWQILMSLQRNWDVRKQSLKLRAEELQTQVAPLEACWEPPEPNPLARCRAASVGPVSPTCLAARTRPLESRSRRGEDLEETSNPQLFFSWWCSNAGLGFKGDANLVHIDEFVKSRGFKRLDGDEIWAPIECFR